MAVDTKQKRMSAATLLKLWHPWVFPIVSGITADERAAVAGIYSGLVIVVPPADATFWRHRKLLLIRVK